MHKQRKTTYILGAGASLHAGYPLIKSMGEQLFAWMRVPRESGVYDFTETANFLTTRFGSDIEQVFNGMQEIITKKQQCYSALAEWHQPCLVEAMRQWFEEIRRKHPAVAYERFASEVVMPGDTIISFNYDVSLESKLRQSNKWAIGDGYGFRVQELPSGSLVRVLKLHGSINYPAILFGGMRSGMIPADGPMGSRPVFGTDALTALGYAGLVDPQFTRPAAALLPLALPTSRKQFCFDTNLGRQLESFWTRLWRSAR